MIVITDRSQWPTARPFPAGSGQTPGVPAATLPDLSIVGRFWMNRGRAWRPRFVSCLSALAPGRADAQVLTYLDWAASRRFNGVRVFAGELHWPELPRPQRLDDVYQRLPWFLNEAAARGLSAEVCAITDSKAGGYNTDDHVQRIAEIVRPRKGHVMVDIGQEVGHGSQAGHVTPDYLRHVGQRFCSDLLWAVGSTGDELARDEDGGGYDGHGGRYIVGHTLRVADLFKMARHRKEGHDIAEHYETVYTSNEPIGAADFFKGSSRVNQPWLFFAFGLLDWLFAGGGTHHNQAGIDIVPPRPGGLEEQCAEAYIQGHAIAEEHFGADALPHFRNSGDPGALTTNGDGDPAFKDRGHQVGDPGPFERIYSFESGGRGLGVALHHPDTYPSEPDWRPEQLAHVSDEWQTAVSTPRPHVALITGTR